MKQKTRRDYRNSENDEFPEEAKERRKKISQERTKARQNKRDRKTQE